MAALTMYINGREIEAQPGSTVLEAARAAGISIPTLCHHPALSNSGGCRMCLVEVEPRGQLQPACTFPVSPGLRVHTHSEKVVRARRFVLELLFSERGHYCMYCAADGQCDLQTLAYEHGLDHWTYPRPDKNYTVDASRPYFVMDHNRCILCRRCIRACSEVAGVHTLDMGQRGAQSLVVADLNVPFGQSSCISCGSCLDVCPTGALVDRRSAYMGGDADLERVGTVCAQCSLGCEIVVRTRSGRVIRIESDWEGATSGGLLCRQGRFAPLYVTAPRVRSPLRRVGGGLVPCTWEEALGLLGERLSAAPQGAVAAVASARATNEELDAFVAAFGPRAARLALFDGAPVAAAPGEVADLAAVEDAAAVLALAADLDDEHEVAACFMRRARDRGARLILADCRATRLSGAAVRLAGPGVEELQESLGTLAPLVVLYGPEASPDLLEALAERRGAAFLGLPAGVNAMGAAARGLKPDGRAIEAELLYVYAADSLSTDLLIRRAAFTAVQSCYRTSLTEAADLVLPALHWSEKAGHLTGADGRLRRMVQAVPAAPWARDDREVLLALERLAEAAH
ncbi:MAG: molybdopterin-dependent oxidoreductase [Anaerolineae bacterium]|nr:molybdopterin-dependent oxidoreductase [Anaerolineae bacterium]